MQKAMEVGSAVETPAAPMVEIVHGDYRCHPCVAICNNRQMLEAHLAGKKHVAKIALCGEAAFLPPTDLPDLPPRESETLTPAGRKRKNASAQGSFRCDICEIDFPSAFPFESHMQGKKHANKAQKKELGDTPTTLSCSICAVSTTCKDAYDMHVNGKKHAAKVASLEKNGEGGEKASDKESFHCEFCDVTVNNKDIFESHRNGKRHAEKVRKIAEGDSGVASQSFACELCQITVTSQTLLDAHLAGKKHMKKLGGGGGAESAVVGGGGATNGATNGAKPAKPAPETITCEVCKVTVNCQQLMDLHLKGKKHLKAIGEKDMPKKENLGEKDMPKKENLGDCSCNICGIQVTSPQLMESHLHGKAHAKKLKKVNEENASMMASSLIQTIREQTKEGDAKMEDLTSEKPLTERQPVAPLEQPQSIPTVAAVAAMPAAPASPARAPRSRRAN